MYGSLTFLFLIQFVLIFEIKYRELSLFRRVQYKISLEGTTIQFDSFYWMQKGFDFMISLLFLQMHTLKIQWQKVTTDFYKFGLYYKDTQMNELV